MERSKNFVIVLTGALMIGGCAEKRTAADSGEDMYVVSDGMLAVDTAAATANGIQILDRNGGVMEGVVVLRAGLSIVNKGGEMSVIGPAPDALSILDENGDNRLDASDPAWDTMHLAVDYNGDNTIGNGEYALIGECGVDALVLDLDRAQAQSLHSDGKIKIVKMPSPG